MKGLIPRTQLFLKRNSSTILTCVGALGVIATAVAAVKATPKALDILEKAKQEKGDKLTKVETIKIAAPAYIPSALIGTATISCIFGANVLNKKQQATLVGLYSLLDSSYKNYRSRVKELYGDDADKQVALRMVENHNKTFKSDEKGSLIFMDAHSLQIFESTMTKIVQAEEDINELLDLRGYALLSDYYELLGITSIGTDFDIGWSKTYLNAHGKDRIDFEYIKSSPKEEYQSENDCYLITTILDPVPIRGW